MKKAKKILAGVLALAMVVSPMVTTTSQAAKKESREIVVYNIKGNILYYFKANKASKFIANAKKGNKVGAGKRKQIKITGKTKFYLRNMKTKKKVRATKAEFKKGIGKTVRHISGSNDYYTGNYCKIKLVGGKCTKITQQHQK